MRSGPGRWGDLRETVRELLALREQEIVLLRRLAASLDLGRPPSIAEEPDSVQADSVQAPSVQPAEEDRVAAPSEPPAATPNDGLLIPVWIDAMVADALQRAFPGAERRPSQPEAAADPGLPLSAPAESDETDDLLVLGSEDALVGLPWSLVSRVTLMDEDGDGEVSPVSLAGLVGSSRDAAALEEPYRIYWNSGGATAAVACERVAGVLPLKDAAAREIEAVLVHGRTPEFPRLVSLFDFMASVVVDRSPAGDPGGVPETGEGPGDEADRVVEDALARYFGVGADPATGARRSDDGEVAQEWERSGERQNEGQERERAQEPQAAQKPQAEQERQAEQVRGRERERERDQHEEEDGDAEGDVAPEPGHSSADIQPEPVPREVHEQPEPRPAGRNGGQYGAAPSPSSHPSAAGSPLPRRDTAVLAVRYLPARVAIGRALRALGWRVSEVPDLTDLPRRLAAAPPAVLFVEARDLPPGRVRDGIGRAERSGSRVVAVGSRLRTGVAEESRAPASWPRVHYPFAEGEIDRLVRRLAAEAATSRT